MKNMLKNKALFYIFIIIILIFSVFFYYFGIFHYNYPIPPGDDGLRHMTEANYIIETGFFKAHKGSADPPLFHILLSIITLITSQDLVRVTQLFTPLLAIISIFSIYFLARRFFNKIIASLSLLLMALFSPQPFDIYEDGTYLNLLAAEVLLLAFLAIIPYIVKKNKYSIKYLILEIILLISIFITHSLSSIYLIVILALLSIFLLLPIIRNNNIYLKYILTLDIFIILLPLLTWQFYTKNIYNKFIAILGYGGTNKAKSLGDNFFSLPPAFNGYVKTYSYTLIILGIVGFIFILLSFAFKTNFFKKIFSWFGSINKNINLDFIKKIFSRKNNLEKLILIIWSGGLIACSRSSFFLLPSRFSRDAIVPIVIMSAIAIYIIFNALRIRKYTYYYTTLIFIAVFSIFIFNNKITEATQYHEQIRLQKSDVNAIEWIKNNTQENDIFLVVPQTVANGNWGSYLNLLANREAIDASKCPEKDDKKCDPIYNPNSQISIEYYKENSINYVYAGEKIFGEFVWKDLIDWSYQEILSQSLFLEKAAEFNSNPDLGSVIIYKVNHEKLNSLSTGN